MSGTEKRLSTRTSNPIVKWVAGVLILLLVGLVILGVGIYRKNNTPVPAKIQTALVTRDTIQLVVQSNGSVQPNADLNLVFGVAGTVNDIKVKVGQHVNQGDTLGKIDDTQLLIAVHQAEASLTSAQASLDKLKLGATPQEISNAQAALASANAKYHQVQTGNYTQSDVASAKAQLDSAKAKLGQLQNGATKADIDTAKAQVDSAKVKLDQVKNGNYSKSDFDTAKANLDAAKVKLEQVKTGNYTQSDIANAKAQLDAAKAKLALLQAGPSPSTVSSAQLKVTNAQSNLDRTVSQQQTNVDNAKTARDQADNAVRAAQDNYNTVYEQTHNSDGTLKDDPRGSVAGTEQRNFDQANRTLQDAYGAQSKAANAYNDALIQQRTTVADAQASLNDAKAQLQAILQPPTYQADLAADQASVAQAQNNYDKMTTGGTPLDIQIAQTSVDQAQANYDKLTQGGTPDDIRAAQDSVDQAQANYDKLISPPTAADVAAAQASIAQAQANYDKIINGGTPDDLTQAQSSVQQAQNALATLQTGPLSQDISISMATVQNAEANLNLAKLKAANATLVAPFAGTVNSVNMVLGQQINASDVVVDLIDNSSFYVNLTIGESDIAHIALNNRVTLTFDAVPTATVTGSVTFISSKSTVSANVVTYLTTVTIPSAGMSARVRAGMTANASVIYQIHPNVLLVPVRALTTGPNGSVVTVRRGGLPIDIPVTTGLNDGTNVEISTTDNSIAENDTVVLNATTTRAPSTTGGGGGGGGGGGRGGFGGGFGG